MGCVMKQSGLGAAIAAAVILWLCIAAFRIDYESFRHDATVPAEIQK